VEVLVAKIRREHPRWGAKRIRMELLRKPRVGVTVPAVRTIVRILHRQGLSQARPRKKPKSAYVRFERPGPMQLWGIDIVGGVQLVDTRTGEVREVKVVTGVDDHSRFCVIATVVERATGRAGCLAFAQALARYGVPQEVITDNGRQFTDRFGRHGARNGEVLFDKICRNNGITHLLTVPFSPNQNGKVERLHGTFRPEFLTDAGPFESIEEAQAAVDAWVVEYNTDRPHQGLDENLPGTPAQRFAPVPAEQRHPVELWLPPALSSVAGEPVTSPQVLDRSPASPSDSSSPVGIPAGAATAIEFDKVVPACGMITVARKLLWLGGYRTGKTVRVWADTDVIHLLVDGARVKSIRSHLSVNDITVLAAQGAVPAGPPPLPAPEDGDALEVDRVMSRVGTVSLGNHVVLAAEILAGRQGEVTGLVQPTHVRVVHGRRWSAARRCCWASRGSRSSGSTSRMRAAGWRPWSPRMRPRRRARRVGCSPPRSRATLRRTRGICRTGRRRCGWCGTSADGDAGSGGARASRSPSRCRQCRPELG